LLIGQCMVKTLNNAGQMKLEDSKVAIWYFTMVKSAVNYRVCSWAKKTWFMEDTYFQYIWCISLWYVFLEKNEKHRFTIKVVARSRIWPKSGAMENVIKIKILRRQILSVYNEIQSNKIYCALFLSSLNFSGFVSGNWG
jgi:hypothetical protein